MKQGIEENKIRVEETLSEQNFVIVIKVQLFRTFTAGVFISKCKVRQLLLMLAAVLTTPIEDNF
jgi:hypothetical protein